MGNTFELCHNSNKDTFEGEIPLNSRGKSAHKKTKPTDSTKSTSTFNSSIFATFGMSPVPKKLEKEQVQKKWT